MSSSVIKLCNRVEPESLVMGEGDSVGSMLWMALVSLLAARVKLSLS